MAHREIQVKLAEAMDALVAIGIRNAALEKAAVAAARRIGSVEVDHGETGCATPEPVAYIRKARARARGRGTRPPAARRARASGAAGGR